MTFTIILIPLFFVFLFSEYFIINQLRKDNKRLRKENKKLQNSLYGISRGLNKYQIQEIYAKDLEDLNIKSKSSNFYNLNSILDEISERGIKNISKDKLNFLKNTN